MRKLLAVLLLVSTSTVALAEGRHGHGGHHGWGGGHQNNHYYNGGSNDFVAPLIFGSILGLALSQPSQPRYEQRRIILQQEPEYYENQNCTGWYETIDRYGYRTRTRTCYGY